MTMHDCVHKYDQNAWYIKDNICVSPELELERKYITINANILIDFTVFAAASRSYLKQVCK